MKDCRTDDNWKNDRMKNRKYMHILEIMIEDNMKKTDYEWNNDGRRKLRYNFWYEGKYMENIHEI